MKRWRINEVFIFDGTSSSHGREMRNYYDGVDSGIVKELEVV